MTINVYDFDGTIYEGDSSVDFYLFCLKNNPRMILRLPAFLFACALYFTGGIDKTGLKQDFFKFLADITDINAQTALFWQKHEFKIKEWYLLQKNDSDVIISASPRFLLEPIAKKLGVRLIASDIDAKTGVFLSPNCAGHTKPLRFKAALPGADDIIFYSDTLCDTSMAQISRKAFMVKGSRLVPWGEYKPSVAERFKNIYLTRDFLLFIFCGGTGTLVNFALSSFLSSKFEATASYAAGYAISLFVTYALNSKLIFRRRLRAWIFIKFCISYIPNFVILFSFVFIFINLYHWNRFIVYAAAGVFGLAVTYIFVRVFAFKAAALRGYGNG
ncbi:MAG: haloacid dehalogenase-like hydrolase [Elusimicrobiota bacterium]|jgi:phosphoserine phosphatase/putative flippase GtrA|nr:haloacid dehalogenase-like hydrolase [Elusimicrobiota bacterium]